MKKSGNVKQQYKREYSSFQAMRQRCNNPNNPAYHNYGGRGIKVCPEWDNFTKFYADMGDRPPGYELDRIDTNGDYCPENCRWVDRITQARNKRSNKLITCNGKTMLLCEWAEYLGENMDTLHARMKRGRAIDGSDIIKYNKNTKYYVQKKEGKRATTWELKTSRKYGFKYLGCFKSEKEAHQFAKTYFKENEK